MWENSNTRTAYGNLLSNLASFTLSGMLQTGLKNHPALGAIDIPGWGNTGETQYSSQNVTYVSGGTINGNQSGAGTQTGLTMTNPHTIVVGDLVKFLDGVSAQTVTRNVTAVTATTISWTSTTAVSVLNGATVTRTGLHFGSTANSGAEIPAMVSDGAEVPTPSQTAQEALIDLYGTNFDNNFFVHTIGLINSPGLAYNLNTKHYGYRADFWGFRINPAVCPGSGNQMCVLTPNELGYTTNTLDPSSALPFSYVAPVHIEPYNNFSTWASTPYDRDQSILWAQRLGATSMETKNGWAQLDTWETATPDVIDAFERSLGYRLYLAKINHASTVTAGNNLTVQTVWYNKGSAPFYAPNYYLAFKFTKSGGETYKYVTTTRPTWRPPSANTETIAIPIPTWLNAETYTVSVGIVYNNTTARPSDLRRPVIRLANTTPADGSFWYSGGTTVVVTNASPTANPTYDYAGSFDSASSQFLLATDNGTSTLDLAGTDFTIMSRWYITDKTADRPIVSKGSPTGTTQNYTLYYKNSNNRLRFTIANGTTVYTVDDATLGSPSTSTWYCTIATFNNSTKEMLIRTNGGATSTATATGSIANTANNFRIGRDASANLWKGRIDKVRLWTRILTADEQTAMCAGAAGRPYEDMIISDTEGLVADAELDEVSGNRTDSFQHWLYTDNGGVTQAASS